MPQKHHVMHGRDHCPGGADPIPCLPDPSGGDTVAGLILATGPDAFWKLNESSGTVAFDSSGNDHDLTQTGSTVTAPPTWGQPAGPPGDQCALFDGAGGEGFNGNANVAMSAFTNNFTAGVWVNFSDLGPVQELIGQGTAGYHIGGGGHGWALMLVTSKFAVLADGNPSYSNADAVADTWYFVAVVRDAGTWKLYVNGLLQSATQSTSISTGSVNTWLANDGFTSHGSALYNGLLSYAFITNSVIPGADLLAIYETGDLGPSGAIADYVWTALGDGTADWRPATIEVEF